ncbi:MAG: PQQ-binding-like beta-propeller repeat protein [Phycisphaerae bacterium]|nr:PQQ-binding-like beta-propeller repeat protein [Phycisphaerae bacterium]
MTCRLNPVILAFLTSLFVLSLSTAQEDTDTLCEALGSSQGICVVLGDPSCDYAFEVVRKSQMLVYIQLPDAKDVNQARQRARQAGFSPTRVQIDQGDLTHLHLADNTADCLVLLDPSTGLSDAEALRVLRPGGRARLGQRERIKPIPDGLDDWSHPYHGPDNNPVSLDRVARAPYLTQFLADPRYGPAPQLALASAGRIFKAFGHVAWHEREEAFLNTLAAFNGFNGTLLWRRPLPEGLMVHRNTMIATPDTLYLGDDRSCKLIDTQTGQIKDEIIPPLNLAGGTFWKWMALEGDTLYALMGQAEPADATMRWKRLEHGWPWDGISKGYNTPENEWGFGCSLLAIDVKTQSVLWHYHEDQPMDSRAVCMKSGRLFAFRFGGYLTCLDAKTGQVLWRKTPGSAPALFESLGEALTRQSWETNWRTTAYLKCDEDALFFAGPQVRKLLAVSTRDGSILWENPYDNFQLIRQEDGLYAISGPWGNNVSQKLDPLTGKVLAEFSMGRRACTRPVATLDSILFRAMGGTVRFDFDSARANWISPMRPSCHDGVTIGNGLLYWWPFACDCQLTLCGLTALGPAGDFDFTPDKITTDRLENGPSGSEVQERLRESVADWPTFRANNQRTTVTQAVVPQTAQLLWQTKPSELEGVRLTAPVTLGHLCLVAGSDGVVRALDTQHSGREQWSAATGGDIRIPPTLWQGRALVGSGDGWVYALETATGRRLWRFRAAPVERKIPVYGELLSTWPAASGILVENNTAYVAAGLVNYDGTYVYALDPATGQVQWCNNTSGHLDSEANTGVSVQGHLLSHGNKLYLAGGNAVSPAVYDLRSGQCLNDPAPLAQCESTSARGWELFLVGQHVIACGKPYYSHPDIPVYDHTVTKKMLHASTGVHDIVWLDNSRLQCYDPIEETVLNQCVTNERIPRHIIQGWGQFRISKTPRWQLRCPGSLAIAVSKNAVVMADLSSVQAVDLGSGKSLWRHTLPAAPVPWGLAVNREGSVLLTLINGQVLCFGSPGLRFAFDETPD